MRRSWPFLALAGLALAACSVLTDLDPLKDGAQTDGGSSNDALAPGSDGATRDGTAAFDAAPDAASSNCALGKVTDLVGYYTFEEGSGSVIHDCSGKNHDGTILKVGTGTWTQGIRGGGLRVASPDGCAELPVTPDFVMGSTGLTVMAWAFTVTYPTSTSNAIVGKNSDLNVAGWRMYAGFVQELGAGVARPLDAGPLFVGKEPLPSGVWNHLATVMLPGGALTFYIDGVNVAQKSWPSAFTEDMNANVRIGCRSDNTGFYDGIVDEVRIYNRALSPTEVALASAKP